MESEEISGQKPRRKWQRWSYRAFVIANVIGVVVAIPLIIEMCPLIKVWWDTRSQESLSQRIEANSPAAAAKSQQKTSKSEADSAAKDLNSLTNQLGAVSKLNDDELKKIVAYQFGAKKPSQADPTQFDRDSSVLHKITRSIATIKGKQYYCYEVDLVDENGNHKTHVDCFEKPDLAYERGMATLELVNNNPQLKKIYAAFAHVLAEKSAEAEEDDPSAPAASEPAIRLHALPK